MRFTTIYGDSVAREAMGHGRADEAGPLSARDVEEASAETDEPNQAFLLLWNGGSSIRGEG